MKKKRIGNDIAFAWTIVDKEGYPYSLDGRDLTLTLSSALGCNSIISPFTIGGDNMNVVMWTFYGKDQKTLGKYTATLVENLGDIGMKTVDKIDAIYLVAHTYQEGGEDSCSHLTTETVELESAIETAAKGDPGEPAGFGEVTASVDSGVGTPSVEVTTSGPNTAKNFDFAFHNLKGQDGSDAEVTAQNIQSALGYVPVAPSDISQFITKTVDDLTNYYLKSETYTKAEDDALLATKQATLVSGTNIKTVNNQSLLGSGNIEIQGGSDDAVLYTPQSLTEAQKTQARTNIGAGTSSFSGSYNDLSNKPTIPAAQVNSDWSASSGVAQILNKPDIPDPLLTYTESGDVDPTVTPADYATREELDQLEAKMAGLLGQRSYTVTQGTALNTTGTTNRLDVQLKQGNLYYLYVDYVEGGVVGITAYVFYGSNTYKTISLTNRTTYCFLADQNYDYGIGLNLPAVSATADGTLTISAHYKGLIRRIDDNEENIADLIADKADTNKPFGNNLFDKDSTEILTNKYINGTGKIVAGNTYLVSPAYLVKPGQSITANKVPSGTGFALFFDKAGNEYAGIKVNGSGNSPATITNNTTVDLWARVSSTTAYKDDLMVNYGSNSLTYEAYKNGTVVYDKTPDFLTCMDAARKVENLDYSRLYTVTQGAACNTTGSSNRLFAPMTAGHKLKVTVTYPEGASSEQFTVYFYTGNTYITGTVTNGTEKEFVFPVDYDSIGFNITAASAIADGTATINVNVQGEVEKLGDDVKDLQERVGVIEGSNLVRLSDVLYHWLNGEKFPIGFQGDSTTDGVSTTGWTVDNSHPAQDTAAGGRGKADYVCELAYPKQLQNLLRAELGSNTLRVYNIGYYGASLANNWNQLEDIYSDVYADVKMVGIVLGINDRGTATDAADFYNDVLTLLIQYVEFFIGKGITPFMVTNQVVTQCGNDPNTVSYSPVYQDYIQTLCNEAKRFVAKKYNLEIIEMNDFGRLLLESSSYSYDSITEDLHFKDLGHKLEAGFLFSQLIPWVNKTDNADKLHFGFNCAKCKTDFRIGAIETTTNDKFKLQVNTTQDSATDKCIFDAYMFNNSKNGAYTVKYLTPVASGYIVMDGDTANPIQITAAEMNLGTWDIGLHHIQVYTGASTTVAFKGFLLESVN